MTGVSWRRNGEVEKQGEFFPLARSQNDQVEPEFFFFYPKFRRSVNAENHFFRIFFRQPGKWSFFDSIQSLCRANQTDRMRSNFRSAPGLIGETTGFDRKLGQLGYGSAGWLRWFTAVFGGAVGSRGTFPRRPVPATLRVPDSTRRGAAFRSPRGSAAGWEIRRRRSSAEPDDFCLR